MYGFNHHYFYYAHNNIDLWTIISSIATVAVAIIAYVQLRSISKTSRADFIHKFRKDFFTKETRTIIKLINEKKLKYNVKKDTFNLGISSYDVDDLVLGYFEDLGVFEKKGYLDIEMIYELFGYYIDVCWNNEAIKKYLSQLKKDDDIYKNFEYIYKKCKDFKDRRL